MFDSAGTIYASIATKDRTFQFDASEQLVTTFTAPSPPGLSSPMGIARDPDDRLYVAGGGSDNIIVFQNDGTYLRSLSHPDLTGPQGVAFDERGHLFSPSYFQDRIVEFDASGNYVRTITDGGLDVPRSIAFLRRHATRHAGGRVPRPVGLVWPVVWPWLPALAGSF